LEVANLTKEHRSSAKLSTGKRREAESVHMSLTQLTLGYKTLHNQRDALEFPVSELREKLNSLSHLKIVVSSMSMKKLQDLQEGMVQEIRNKGEEENKELETIRDK
jgi:hypothetical protein